jgi:hypothetical protein
MDWLRGCVRRWGVELFLAVAFLVGCVGICAWLVANGYLLDRVLICTFDETTGVTIVSTRRTGQWLSRKAALRYLARQPEVGYCDPAKGYAFGDPAVTRDHDVLAVDYRRVDLCANHDGTLFTGLRAVQEAWYWLPGVRALTLTRQRQEISPLAGELSPAQYLYVGHPVTGEVGHLQGIAVKDPAQAQELLTRQVLDYPAAAAGFAPLVPPGVTLRVGTPDAHGVVTLDLPQSFPWHDAWRLNGLVLTFTQFPAISAVRFTAAGRTMWRSVGGVWLSRPITPLQLTCLPPRAHRIVLPPSVPHFRDPWPIIAGSPRGNYLVVMDRLYDMVTECWQQLAYAPQAGDELQWLPDESGLIGKRWHPSGRYVVSTFFRLPRHGQAVELLQVERLVDWRVLPDGSGLVLTRTADSRPGDGAGWGYRIETLHYTFADGRLARIELSDWFGGDWTGGEMLCIRRDGADWIATYAPESNTLYWLNLRTRRQQVVSYPNCTPAFSPDGQYWILGHQLQSAPSWPGRTIKGHPPVELPGPEWGNAWRWSPDSRLIAYTVAAGYAHMNDWTFQMGCGSKVLDTRGREVMRLNTLAACWVGSNYLLISGDRQGRRCYYLRSLTGGTDRILCTGAWRGYSDE